MGWEMILKCECGYPDASFPHNCNQIDESEYLNSDVKIIDKIEQQVQHCLREYQNKELEDKLVELSREWFFKGLKKGGDLVSCLKEKFDEEKKKE